MSMVNAHIADVYRPQAFEAAQDNEPCVLRESHALYGPAVLRYQPQVMDEHSLR